MQRLLTLLLLLAAPLFAEEEPVDPAEEVTVEIQAWELGKEWQSQVLANYQEGVYQPFFQKISSLYEKGGALSSMEQILQEERISLGSEDQEGTSLEKRIEAFYKGLDKERERTLADLGRLCKTTDEELEVCRFVEALTKGERPKKEGLEAIAYFQELAISNEEAATSQEKELKRICREYHIKRLFLHADVEFNKRKRDEQNEHLFALGLQQFDLMEGVFASDDKSDLKDKIEAARKAFMIRGQRAHNWEFLFFILHTPIVEAHKLYDKVKGRMVAFKRAQRALILKNRLSVGKFDSILYPLF